MCINVSTYSHIPSIYNYVEYICYDDGRHLRKFARHPSRRDITLTAQKLASVEIVIDKLHMAGHLDKWCLENCNPHLFQDLDHVCNMYMTYMYI